MNTLAIILLCIFGAALLWLAWEYKNAPAGYEDERGFHTGTPDAKDGTNEQG